MSMLRRRLMMRTAKPYIELEYIESTGTQYIDTEICPNPNTIIEIDLSFSGTFSPSNGGGSIIGARDTNERMSCNFGGATTQSRQMWFWIGLNSTPVYSLGALPVESRNTLAFQNGKARYGTRFTDTSSFKSNKVTLPLTLFGMNHAEGVLIFGYYHMLVYCCKLYDGETLMRDFIPVMRKSDGEICLYDKVTQRFFTNQGTGEFIGGTNAG